MPTGRQGYFSKPKKHPEKSGVFLCGGILLYLDLCYNEIKQAGENNNFATVSFYGSFSSLKYFLNTN